MYSKKPGLVHMDWRDLFVFILATIHLQIVRTGVKAATPSVNGCPEFAAEAGTIACTCTAGVCLGSNDLTWVGLNPPSNVLYVRPVKREDDRKTYTCQQICDGQTSTVDYTFRVAYGPFSDNMSVSGDLPFKTNGTQVMNLTCQATNVNPAAAYYWRGLLCGKVNDSNTCSFVPQREDNMKVETCWARNPNVTTLQSSKNVTIHLQYTPPESPHIQGPGQTLKAGNTVSCTVTGGKPLVQSVSFSCDNPHHPDQNDTVNSTSVTSYITINTSQANENNMTCHCSAHWAPEPSYYPTSVSASFRTEFPPRLNSSDGPGYSPVTAVNMSQQGINITLRAFPSPHIFRFTEYNDTVDHAGNSSLDYMFNATTSKMIPGSPDVTCHIRPKHTVQKGWLYEVNISNGVGSVLYYFSFTGAPPPPEVTTSPPAGDDHLAPAGDGYRTVIIGASVGGTAAGVLLITIIVCCCKKKIKDERKKQDARFFNVGGAEGSSNPTFNTDNQDTDSGIGDRESPPLDMSTSNPCSKPAQHHLDGGYVDVGAVRDGVMRKKSARGGQPYEVTSLVKGGGARIAGETTKPPATNSKVGYTEPWTDYHIDMPDGQPSVNKPPADITTSPAGNNASPDHYQGPRGEEYALVGAHGKGGLHSYLNVDPKQKSKPPYSNVPDDRPSEVDASCVFESPAYSTSHNKGTKASGKGKQSGAVSTNARGSDTYDHFVGQGHDLTQNADPTYSHIGKF